MKSRDPLVTHLTPEHAGRRRWASRAPASWPAVPVVRVVMGLFLMTLVCVTALSSNGRASALSSPAGVEAPPRDGQPHHPAAGPGGETLVWGPAPAGFPPGAELALVQGDPAVSGTVFTIRLRMPNDYVLPPHFHPEDEHVTVLAGRFDVGLGNAVDDAAIVASLQRHGFITAPKRHTHWGIARGRTTVQVHGVGPFQTTFVDAQGTPLSQ